MKNKKGFTLTSSMIIVIMLMLIVVIFAVYNLTKTSNYANSKLFQINQLSYNNDCQTTRFFCERVIKDCGKYSISEVEIEDELRCDSKEQEQWNAFKKLDKECWNRDSCNDRELEEWEEYLLNHVYNNEEDITATMQTLTKEEETKVIESTKINLESNPTFTLTDKKKEIVQKAYLEYEKWNYGKIKESDSIAYPYLKNYWDNVHFNKWTPSSVPWSAAFISYVVDDFNSAGHWGYINNVYNKKISGWTFYEPNAKKIEIGDIVCKPREGDKFDPKGYYKAHCDIVVNIENNKASLIGGNVGDTVGLVSISLNSEGKILNTNNYIGILS